ncbi:MAG: outer membrane beta-barrel protein [Bacteroidia bacterium]|nr:outer membrane beta-barrel protein [Bacteroidia bacterium]
MYKRLLLKTLLITLPFSSFSQYVWDFGGSVGAASFLGDVGGKDTPAKKFIGDLNPPSTRVGLGGFARYKLNSLLSFQGSLSYSLVSGDDKNSTYLPRKCRNLNFRNNIIEMQLTTQVYFFDYPGVVQTFQLSVDYKAYLFGGISFFHHNPQGNYNGSWVNLQPLQTEGVPYSLWGAAIPLGLGSYFTINRKNRIGFEVCWRKTFTDYLDDVSTRYVDPKTLPSPTAVAMANRSQELAGSNNPKINDLLSYNYLPTGLRGDPKGKDTWFTVSLTYSYVIRGKSSFYRSRYPGLFGKKNKKRKIRAKF